MEKALFPVLRFKHPVTDSINGIDRMVEKAVEVIESQDHKKITEPGTRYQDENN